MTRDELKIKLPEIFPSIEVEEGTEPNWLYSRVAAEELRLAESLLTDKQLQFDYLFCLTCIDWKTHLDMVYHFTSTLYRHTLVVKAKLNIAHPVIETVSGSWKTAIFHEREVYEMFGVEFLHHPDLRLLILPDGWEGKNPMRKDFEDPVNMIRL